MRIVSLVPSLTEYLWSLGLDAEVVGITKFCVHPQAWKQTKVKVGGTKKVNFAAVQKLAPDLIIANKEENTKEDIAHLMQHYEVLLTEINSIEQAFSYLLIIGERVDKKLEAEQLLFQIRAKFQNVSQIGSGLSFLYFIWKDPYFLVGEQTYIHAFLSHFGFQNACSLVRYPSLEEWQESQTATDKQPDLIFLSSEPYPFAEKHLDEMQAFFPNSKIQLIDGEMCSWYGARMLKAASYLKREFKNQKA
ncbi:MAG: ABC transporter substrate-binding protein [Flavobacteriales bacterium]